MTGPSTTWAAKALNALLLQQAMQPGRPLRLARTHSCKGFLFCAWLAVGLGAAVGVGGDAQAEVLSPFAGAAAGEKLPAPWRVTGFPGGRKPVSQFAIEQLRGEAVLKVITDKSYGSALHEVPPMVLAAGSKLHWRWRLEEPLLQSDLKKREGDDSAIKVCALFDMGTDKLGLLDRTQLRMARGQTTDPIPAATLCYVWDHLLPVGTRLPNVFSPRVRFVVMDSGEQKLGQWVSHERDLVADFMQAFGHETDAMPPLIGIAVGADSDNTGGKSLAYVAAVVLVAK